MLNTLLLPGGISYTESLSTLVTLTPSKLIAIPSTAAVKGTTGIVPFGKMVVNEQAKLVIETADPVVKVIAAPTPSPAKAIVQEVKSSPASPSTASTTPQESSNKKNLLAALQHKYGSQYNIEEVKEAIPLKIDGRTTPSISKPL